MRILDEFESGNGFWVRRCNTRSWRYNEEPLQPSCLGKNRLFFQRKMFADDKTRYKHRLWWESSMNFKTAPATPGRLTVLAASRFVCVSVYSPLWTSMRTLVGRRPLLGKNSLMIKHDIKIDFDENPRWILKLLLRSAAGRAQCCFTLCVCFCVVPSLKRNENPISRRLLC